MHSECCCCSVTFHCQPYKIPSVAQQSWCGKCMSPSTMQIISTSSWKKLHCNWLHFVHTLHINPALKQNTLRTPPAFFRQFRWTDHSDIQVIAYFPRFLLRVAAKHFRRSDGINYKVITHCADSVYLCIWGSNVEQILLHHKTKTKSYFNIF